MSVKVNVYNVGHGDAIRIFFDKKLCVVRDFGRSIHAIKTNTSVGISDLIQRGFAKPNMPIDAVLSHPHNDHYNGFERLSRKKQNKGIFETSFMPWLDYRTKKALGWQMTRLAAYLYAYYGVNTRPHRNAQNWLKATPIMAKLGKRFMGVAAGHSFSWPETANVLWPPPPGAKIKAVIVSAKVRDHISRIEKLLSDNNEKKKMGTISDAGDTIAKILSNYYSDDPAKKAVPKDIKPEEDLSNIDNILSNLGIEIAKGIKQTDKAFSAAWQHFYKEVDDHSIVFEIGNKALFLSDINPAPMNALARRSIMTGRQYNLLKSSHHGTRLGNYLIKKPMIYADIVLHNCGPVNTNYNGPIKEYCHFNPKRIVYTDKHPKAEPLLPACRRKKYVFTKKSETITL